jgi:hypothetical protein
LVQQTRPVVNYAERRHVASLYATDKASLDTIDLTTLLNDRSSALPFVPAGEEMLRNPRRMKEPSFQADFLANLHRNWLRDMLGAKTAM